MVLMVQQMNKNERTEGSGSDLCCLARVSVKLPFLKKSGQAGESKWFHDSNWTNSITITSISLLHSTRKQASK